MSAPILIRVPSKRGAGFELEKATGPRRGSTLLPPSRGWSSTCGSADEHTAAVGRHSTVQVQTVGMCTSFVVHFAPLLSGRLDMTLNMINPNPAVDMPCPVWRQQQADMTLELTGAQRFPCPSDASWPSKPSKRSNSISTLPALLKDGQRSTSRTSLRQLNDGRPKRFAGQSVMSRQERTRLQRSYVDFQRTVAYPSRSQGIVD